MIIINQTIKYFVELGIKQRSQKTAEGKIEPMHFNLFLPMNTSQDITRYFEKTCILSTVCPIICVTHLAAYVTLIMENKLWHTEYQNVNYAFHWLLLNPCFVMDLGIRNYSPEAEITACFLQGLQIIESMLLMCLQNDLLMGRERIGL